MTLIGNMTQENSRQTLHISKLSDLGFSEVCENYSVTVKGLLNNCLGKNNTFCISCSL